MFEITNALANLIEGVFSLLCLGVVVVVVIVTADSILRLIVKGRRP